MSKVSRRGALKLMGSLGAAAGMGTLPISMAQAQSAVTNGGGFNRFKLGDFTLMVVSDGQTPPGATFPNWGANEGRQADFEQTLRENFIDPNKFVNNFNPMVVDTGKNKILIDTGRGQGGQLVANLTAAGIKPSDIDTVFITHGHGDHIGGLLTNGQPTFPNAKLVMGETEMKFWLGQATPPANLVALKDRFALIGANQEIVSGLTTVSTPGHTVGHMSVLVASGNQQMMHYGDAAGHWILSLRYPEHFLGFDSDKAQVVKTRAELFAKAAAEKHLVVGYHFPWPAAGYVRKAANGYEFVPAFFTFQG